MIDALRTIDEIARIGGLALLILFLAVAVLGGVVMLIAHGVKRMFPGFFDA